MTKERKMDLFVFGLFVMLGLAMNVFAGGSDPFSAFKSNFYNETKTYAIPVILLIVIAATGITYMRTKDWTVSLVVGGIAAALIGGAGSLAGLFSDYNFSG